jgi:hypothetical protein
LTEEPIESYTASVPTLRHGPDRRAIEGPQFMPT